MVISGKGATQEAAHIGVTTGNTTVVFEKSDQQSPLNLTGKAKTYVQSGVTSPARPKRMYMT